MVRRDHALAQSDSSFSDGMKQNLCGGTAFHVAITEIRSVGISIGVRSKQPGRPRFTRQSERSIYPVSGPSDWIQRIVAG